DAAEDDGLDGKSRAEPEEDAPVLALAGGGQPILGGALAHLVEDEEHAGAGHVAVLGEDVARGPKPVAVEAELGLDLVKDGGAGVRGPEDGVPVGDAERREGVVQHAADVPGDEPRHVLEEVEGEPFLAEVAVDGALRLREDGLRRRHQPEQRPLLAGGKVVVMGADDHRGGAVAEERLADERVEVGLGRAPERDGGDLGAHDQDPRAAVVLGEVLGDAEHRAAGEAALLVQHEAAHGGAQAEQPDEAVVGAGHVHAGGGADDEVRDRGPRLAPLLERRLRRRRAQLGDLRHHHVLPRVQRRRLVRADVGILLQDLLRQTQLVGVAVPMANTVAGPSARCCFLSSSTVSSDAISRSMGDQQQAN
ncbi:hypothetical protein EJB05_02812, partial [Eragrostis curvula]